MSGNRGLSTCWTAWFKQKEVREILNIPPNKYICAIVCLGYADQEPERRPRRNLEDMVYYDTWGNRTK